VQTRILRAFTGANTTARDRYYAAPVLDAARPEIDPISRKWIFLRDSHNFAVPALRVWETRPYRAVSESCANRLLGRGHAQLGSLYFVHSIGDPADAADSVVGVVIPDEKRRRDDAGQLG